MQYLTGWRVQYWHDLSQAGEFDLRNLLKSRPSRHFKLKIIIFVESLRKDPSIKAIKSLDPWIFLTLLSMDTLFFFI